MSAFTPCCVTSRAIGTRAIAFVTPQRNTIEIMRLFATYHSAHARFTL
jgi:hypothetical protein